MTVDEKVNSFGLLLPVTSRGLGTKVVENLRTFLDSFRRTTTRETSLQSEERGQWKFDFFIGVDAGDAVLDPQVAGSCDLQKLFGACLAGATWRLHVFRFDYPAGHVCKMWRDLARAAFEVGCDFVTLLGDDLTLESEGWPQRVSEVFADISLRRGVPFGFGCVAFRDDAFSGFPTFPVLHRTHFEIFPDGIFSDCFVNQGADPFLFQVYRYFNCAALMGNTTVINAIGGANVARYDKQNVNWSGSMLKEAVDRAEAWLTRAGAPLRRCLTLDVIVPISRQNEAIIQSILALPVPSGVTTMFILIFDRPERHEAVAWCRDLERRHATNPMVRIRLNRANLGASASRNRGLDESSAEWVLFLDDDVIPQSDLLETYATAIHRHPDATGFVGTSLLPEPKNSNQAAVHIANISYFWTIAEGMPNETELPWGITANLAVRREPEGSIRFSEAFPKTGGGEDIDFCLRLRAWQRQQNPNGDGFVSAPAAVVRHPWWDGGKPRYSHFFGWSRGDGLLIDLFRPKLSFASFPDLGECLFFLGVALVVECLVWLVDRDLSASLMINTMITGTAFVCADLTFEFYTQASPIGNSYGIRAVRAVSWPVRVLATVEGVLIRTWSQAGRLYGHWERGRLLPNLLQRFNWFGSMWASYPLMERQRTFKMCVLRVTFAAAILWLIGN